MEKCFNLCSEPWITVRRGTELVEVSLFELFDRAHDYDALACELPTLDLAILRLLQSLVYAAIARDIDDYSVALDRWHELYNAGRFPSGKMRSYLERYHERFYLFHPETPFYQVAGLRANDGKVAPVTQMVADVPSREDRRFFSEMSGDAVKSLSFAQAARWLVHLQAFDYAGKKNSIVGGSPNGGGTGWLGKLGNIYAVGDNLFQTLMLNLVLCDNDEVVSVKEAPWERQPSTAAKCEIYPKSFVELLTVQSRRALLTRDGERVVGVLASYGDVFSKEDMYIEQMSGWHKSSMKNQGFIPSTHTSQRSMWRDLTALMAQKGDDTDKVHRPGILDWLNDIGYEGMLNLCAVGYEYGAMQGVVTTMVHDGLTIHADLVTKLKPQWTDAISELLLDTDKAVGALGWLAADLDKAAGGNGDSVRAAPRERAYFMLDEPFREWLHGVDPAETSTSVKRMEWYKTALKILLVQGAELVAAAGSAAFKGRTVKEGGKEVLMCTPKAERKFRASVYKLLKGGE